MMTILSLCLIKLEKGREKLKIARCRKITITIDRGKDKLKSKKQDHR